MPCGKRVFHSFHRVFNKPVEAVEVGEKREKSLHKSMSSEKRTAILTKNLQSQVYGEKDSAFGCVASSGDDFLNVRHP